MSGSKKILIIEDNPQNLELAKDLLEFAGYEVFAAEDAEEGLPIARRETPSIILLDFQLPGINGLEILKIIRQDDGIKDSVCIFVTASATSSEIGLLRESGSDGCITKPINTRTFVEQIEKIVDEK